MYWGINLKQNCNTIAFEFVAKSIKYLRGFTMGLKYLKIKHIKKPQLSLRFSK
jgi:hypothetical protein